MKRGFYTIMAAQFFSSLADNALLLAALALLRASKAADWQQAALVPMFALFYVVLAPFVGAFADSMPKGRVMLISNLIKVVGCMLMLFGTHPLMSYAIVGLCAAVEVAPFRGALHLRRSNSPKWPLPSETQTTPCVSMSAPRTPKPGSGGR